MPAPGATHAAGIRPGLTVARGAVVKVCPVVLRNGGLLAFHHPRAGCQLVKGTPEPGEAPAEKAMRELLEESGLHRTAQRHLGTAAIGAPGVAWHFVLMQGGAAPDRWTHFCADDGGHLFRFFWQPLGRASGRGWHPLHVAALGQLRRLLARRRRRQPAR